MPEAFVNPWLLGGLALVSLPVIIHLLNRRRYQVHDWAAMEFLLKAQVMNRRRVKLEDLILLLLRMAVIALLVLVVARPMVERFGSWNEDERLVVIDDSGSMDLVLPTGSVFGSARESATNQIRDAVGSVPVSLWFGSRPAERPLEVAGDIRGGVLTPGQDGVPGDPALSEAVAASDLFYALAETRPVDSLLRFDKILERVLDIATADPEPRLRSVVLISDFRRQDWLDDGGELRDPLKFAFEELDRREKVSGLRFQFIDVGESDAENVGITDFRTIGGHVLAGVAATLVVEITSYGKEVREGIQGEIEVGKPGSAAFELAQSIPLPPVPPIPPGEKRGIEVEHTFESPGEYPLRVRLASDRLEGDDESYLVVDVREGLRVVVADGDPRADRLSSESGFLLAALLPRGDAPTGALPEVITEEIRAETLEEADVVLLLNRSGISDAEQDVLSDFVERGGGLGVFLGDRVDAADYRDAARSPPGAASSPLLPAALGEPQGPRRPGERVRMKIDEAEHALFNVFRGIDGLSVEGVMFDKYFDLRPVEGAVVVAHYEDASSTPAIVESRHGKGRVMLINTSADRDWGDWPTDISYPIAMQELVRYLAPARVLDRQVTVGDALVWDVVPGWRYEVVLPGGEREPLEGGGDVAARPTRSFHRTERAGFYRVVATPTESSPASDPESRGAPGADTGEPAARWYACRWNPRESELEALGEEGLRAVLDPLGIDYSVGARVDIDALRREQEGEIWRYLALGAGIFLLLELLAAWWFGRR
ncbi:MAG: BatA domain-containing protein [Planctomycetota bacterium]|nr:BatA domain-containing protein [Planctomycetota bacterium]